MWETEKELVLEAAQRMAERGFVVGTAGNISMRLTDSGGRDLAAITPNNRYYDTLTVDDIGVLDFDGQPVEGELVASIESMLHIGIYRARKKVNAVVHAHPIFGSIISVLGNPIPPILDDQVTYLGGEIKVAPYSLPGSQDLAGNVVSTLGPQNAVVLANHGTVAVGRDMREAFTHLEMLEKTARIYLYALGAGKVDLLPADALEMEQAYFNYLFGEG